MKCFGPMDEAIERKLGLEDRFGGAIAFIAYAIVVVSAGILLADESDFSMP